LAVDLEQLYREDFYAWLRAQAGALRRLEAERWNGPLDLPRLAEEVEDLGSEQKHAVESQLRRLMQHLLKLEHSPAADPRAGWLNTVDDAREEIGARLTRSMRPEIEDVLNKLYAHASRKARRDLLAYREREAADALPAENPYPLDRLIDEGWYPPNRHGLIDEA